MGLPKRDRTVIFGPFIGELGWELLFWHGLVRRFCETEFSDYFKVAVSRPDRQAFYPKVDHFEAFPIDRLPQSFSSRGYYCDGWRNGYPGKTGKKSLFNIHNGRRIITGKRPVPIDRVVRHRSVSIEPIIHNYMTELKSSFGGKPKIISPLELNSIMGIRFGIDLSVKSTMLDNQVPVVPTFQQQNLQKISSVTTSSQYWIDKHLPQDKEFVAVFPRQRTFRRADKNWTYQNYLTLIHEIKKNGFRVLILGEPTGAYFSGERIDGCVNLVDVNNVFRFDLQIAALARAKLAVGGMSGALLVALAAGTPSVIFGYPEMADRYRSENYLNTPMMYVEDMFPDPHWLWSQSQTFLANL